MGSKRMLTIGSRRMVMSGSAKRTSGGLTKADLMMSHGRIVSRKKHFTAKKEMRLVKYGYGAKKGKFGYIKLNSSKRSRSRSRGRKSRGKSRSRRMRGGHAALAPLAPQDLSVTPNNLQALAGMSGGSGMKAMSDHGDANWSGDTAPGAYSKLGSVGVQLEAGMSGGRRRRRHKRSRRHRGGTCKQPTYLSPANVENRALLA